MIDIAEFRKIKPLWVSSDAKQPLAEFSTLIGPREWLFVNAETAAIGVAEWQSSQPGGFDKPPIEPKYLKGGESCEVWVHSGQYLIVKEHKQ